MDKIPLCIMSPVCYPKRERERDKLLLKGLMKSAVPLPCYFHDKKNEEIAEKQP